MPSATLAAAGIVAWLLPYGPPEAPCEAMAVEAARQQLGGDAGVASVDVSADGRIVAFVSLARLAAADTNTIDDVYTVDRETGRVALESITAARGSADGSSLQPRLSADGSVLVFASMASALTSGSGVAASVSQVLRRDRRTGTTTLVSHTPGGAPGNGWSGHADVSGDGRYVVFQSQAVDLVAGVDANGGGSDIYLFDAVDGAVRRISLNDVGVQADTGQSVTPAIDDRGRVVAFTSTAPLDGPARARSGDPVRSVFVRDLVAGRTRRVSATRAGGVPDGASFYPSISGDGRLTAFVSVATDLDRAETRSRRSQIYLHDAATGRLRLVSRNVAGGAADAPSRHPALSADGRFVVFSSDASDLMCGAACGRLADVNLIGDVYRIELATSAADRVSGSSRDAWWTASGGAAVDAAGHVIVFSSRQPVDEADLGVDDDLFVTVLPGTTADAARPVRARPCTTQPPPGRPARR